MNVYDFDGTIYNGDSTFDFFFYLMKKRPKVLICMPKTFLYAIKYIVKSVDKTAMKEVFYEHLKCLKNGEIEKYVKDFWKSHKKNIYPYYLKQKKPSDVIISASPSYILMPICKELGVGKLICSKVDKHTGKYKGKNCRDKEKVSRFFKEFPRLKKMKKPIDNFYTDSSADLPLVKISKKSYKVSKNGRLSKYSVK